MRRITKKSIAITTGALIVLAGTGVAYAYWTTGGTGSGTAGTGSSANIVVNQTSDISGMGPGVAPVFLAGDFTNATGGSVYVTTVTVAIASVSQGDVTPAVGCSAADYTLTGTTMQVNAEVAAGLDTGTGVPPTGSWGGAVTGATIGFNDTEANQDACKNATVNLTYTIA